MDWMLLLMFGVVGAVSTFSMIEVLRYFHDKENK
jgi:fluoride ion exporter CrcB/FEX